MGRQRRPGCISGSSAAHNWAEDKTEDGGTKERARHTVPGHERHAHGDQTPAEQRNLLELGLGEVPAVSEHPRLDGQMLDHVEVAPAHMIGDDDGGLGGGKLVPGDDDVGAVEPLEDELDAGPAGPRDGAGEPIGQEGVEGPQQQEEREEQVLKQQGKGPGGYDGYAAEVGEQVAEGALHDGWHRAGTGLAGLERGLSGRVRTVGSTERGRTDRADRPDRVTVFQGGMVMASTTAPQRPKGAVL